MQKKMGTLLMTFIIITPLLVGCGNKSDSSDSSSQSTATSSTKKTYKTKDGYIVNSKKSNKKWIAKPILVVKTSQAV